MGARKRKAAGKPSPGPGADGHRAELLHDQAAAVVPRDIASGAPGDVVPVWATAVLLGLLQLGVYGSTLFPTVPGGDSGELISTAHVLGVAHPPGYPLFTMLAKLAMVAIPVGSMAWRVNLLSAMFSAGAGVLLFLSSVELTGHQPAGVVAVAIFNFARLQWLYAITGEVFALNNLLLSAMVYQLIRFQSRPSLGAAAAGAFVCGLALSNQHTSVLFIVVIAPWVLWTGRETVASSGKLAAIAFAAMLGMAPYGYCVWSATVNTSPLTWGDQSTMPGFMKHLLRQEYGTFSLAKGGRETASFWLALKLHAVSTSEESFHLAGPLALAGLLALRRLPTALPLAGMLFCYIGFFNWRANLDMSNPLLAGVQERFWMQPNLAKLEGALAVLLLSGQIGSNYQARDESSNRYIANFGEALLRGLPKDSILLLYGDLPGNAARYVQWCDGFRPDVRLIDLEMMTFEWYLPMLRKSFPGVKFPGTVYRHCTECFNMKEFFDANIDAFNIFVYENLNPEDQSWHGHYHVWRHGLTRAVIRSSTPLNPQEWLDSALPAVPMFKLPNPEKYDERTWERVVYDGVLASGVFLAIFFEENAVAAAKSGNTAGSVACYQAALKAYAAVFDSPHLTEYREHFWDKNYGLIGYSLLQTQKGTAERTKLKKLVRTHWQAYIDSPAEDPQKADMTRYLSSLQ